MKRGNIMDSISYTYKVERMDTRNFHGWVIFECSAGMEEEIFSSASYDDIKNFMHDLGA
jgi:hypothetical protein